MASSNFTARRRRGDALIRHALEEIESRLQIPGLPLSAPEAVRDYLRLHLRSSEVERFYVLFLDAHNRHIATEEVARGTVTQTTVFPREVARSALRLNASAVILAHNHPSGVAEPSPADWLLTGALLATLKLIDVRVHDHFVVGRSVALSMRELGTWAEIDPDAQPAPAPIAPKRKHQARRRQRHEQGTASVRLGAARSDS